MSKNAPSTHRRYGSQQQRFKDSLRSAQNKEEPAEKEQTPVARL